MESATLTSRTLQIDGMTSEACVQKVTGVLKGVQGITTSSVKIGSATIEADDTGRSAACAALNNAGFKTREGAKTAGAADSTNPSSKAIPENKDRNQGCPSTQHPASAVPAAAGTGAAKSGNCSDVAEKNAASATPKVAGATH